MTLNQRAPGQQAVSLNDLRAIFLPNICVGELPQCLCALMSRALHEKKTTAIQRNLGGTKAIQLQITAQDECPGFRMGLKQEAQWDEGIPEIPTYVEVSKAAACVSISILSPNKTVIYIINSLLHVSIE